MEASSHPRRKPRYRRPRRTSCRPAAGPPRADGMSPTTQAAGARYQAEKQRARGRPPRADGMSPTTQAPADLGGPMTRPETSGREAASSVRTAVSPPSGFHARWDTPASASAATSYLPSAGTAGGPHPMPPSASASAGPRPAERAHGMSPSPQRYSAEAKSQIQRPNAQIKRPKARYSPAPHRCFGLLD